MKRNKICYNFLNKINYVRKINMDFFSDLIAERIGGKNFGKSDKIYKFELIKRAKAEARLKYPDIKLIDMGVGNRTALPILR